MSINESWTGIGNPYSSRTAIEYVSTQEEELLADDIWNSLKGKSVKEINTILCILQKSIYEKCLAQ